MSAMINCKRCGGAGRVMFDFSAAATRAVIHDAIHRWHHSDTDAELHQWLGLTWEQYAAWVERGTLPDGYELPMRARSTNPLTT